MVREVDCRRLYTCETYLTTNHRLKNNNAWSGKACSPSKVASGSELVEMFKSPVSGLTGPDLRIAWPQRTT